MKTEPRFCPFPRAGGQCGIALSRNQRYCTAHQKHVAKYGSPLGEFTRELPAVMALLLSHHTHRSAPDALAR